MNNPTPNSPTNALNLQNFSHFFNLSDNSLSPQTSDTWLLPDGVMDLLPTEAFKQENLRHELLNVLMTHGYEPISPPLIEYTESLLGHATEDLKRQTFKIIDQFTGRMMGVRADMTPQIARIDANMTQKFGTNVGRYCYTGHVVYTLPKGLFGSRIPLQLGAEIFGESGLNADLELLNVLLNLLKTGKIIDNCHIDIGHVAIFETLCQLANLPLALKEKFVTLYANKALPELQALCQDLANVDNEAIKTYAHDFYILGQYANNLQQLFDNFSPNAKQNLTIKQAIDDLTQLVDFLATSKMGISIDVSAVQGYHYHTGVVFNVYVANESLPIVRGGRFVNQYVSETRHATGFSCDLTRWQNHIESVKKSLVVVPFEFSSMLADKNHQFYQSLNQTIQNLREQGVAVVVALSEQDQPKATHQLQWLNHSWQQVAIDC
nr:ATP phosphoribosyltransferase regulatory subunit [uncultured Moraxella sp.]